MLTCIEGHHSLLLDSRDTWSETLRSGRRKQKRCRCGETFFHVALHHVFREDGDVRSIDVIPICRACGAEQAHKTFEIDYSPATGLIDMPLDPIGRPWLKAKSHQATAYWQTADARRFAAFLMDTLGARACGACKPNELREVRLADVQFEPELQGDLYFTNIAQIAPSGMRDPHTTSPFLRLSRPIHMSWPTGILLLHYIEFADEVLHDATLHSQPSEFTKFAKLAHDWLRQNLLSARGSHTADNSAEYARVAPFLRKAVKSKQRL